MKRHGQCVVAHPAYSIYCALDLVEYYEFCVLHQLDLFWCELIHPQHLDVRRYSEPIRQQAIAEIDSVVEKYGQRNNLAIDTLKRYRMTLVDNSYLYKFKEFDPPKFHKEKEQELKPVHTFVQLWPELANQV
jgi:hypothetical protein